MYNWLAWSWRAFCHNIQHFKVSALVSPPPYRIILCFIRARLTKCVEAHIIIELHQQHISPVQDSLYFLSPWPPAMPFLALLPPCDHFLEALALCVCVCGVGWGGGRACLSAVKVSGDWEVEGTHNLHSLPAALQQGSASDYQPHFTPVSQLVFPELCKSPWRHLLDQHFEEHNLFALDLVFLPSSDASAVNDLNRFYLHCNPAANHKHTDTHSGHWRECLCAGRSALQVL